MSNFTRSYFFDPPNHEVEDLIERIRDELKNELEPPAEITQEEMKKLLQNLSRKVDKIFLEQRKIRARLRCKL